MGGGASAGPSSTVALKMPWRAHEMGHALSLPHWGEGAYQQTEPGENQYRYPYGGIGDNGGGRGDTWNFYQNIHEFVLPICSNPNRMDREVWGQERSIS